MTNLSCPRCRANTDPSGAGFKCRNCGTTFYLTRPECLHGEERVEVVAGYHSDWVCVKCGRRRTACGHLGPRP